jgi:signal transduction histidine kinase
VLFALASLIPLFVVVYFFLDRSIDRNSQLLVDNEYTIAGMVDSSLSGYLNRNVAALENLSQVPAVTELDSNRVNTLLGEVTTVRPEINGLFVVNEQLQLVGSSGNLQPPGLLDNVSDQLGQTMVNREVRVSPRIDVSDESTIVVVSVPVIPVSETETVSDGTGGTATNPTVPQSPTPPSTPPGQVVGVIGAILALDNLEQLVLPFARGETEIAIVSESEVFLATNDIYREESAFLQSRGSVIQQALDGETGDVITRDMSGARRVDVYQPVTFEGATWAVIVSNPTIQTFAQNVWSRGVIVLTLAALVILAMAVALGELTARPLRLLSRKAAAMQRGDFGTTIEPIGSGEILSLSTAMSEMSHQLESQVHGLEQSQSERERQTGQMRDLLRRTLRLQEDERRRIAGEIHDAVSPLITGALYQARALKMTNGSTPVEDRDLSLTKVGQLLERASEELHGVIFDLRPPDLDDIGVVAALEAYIHSLQRTGFTCTLEVTDDLPPLTPEVRLGIYRIVQEALHNVMRHSGADEVVVRLESTSDLLRITIRDNGAGFDPERAVRPTSLGLLSMRERAAVIGATFTIVSRPGGGTAIVLERPNTGNVMSDDVLADLIGIEGHRSHLEVTTPIPENGTLDLPVGVPVGPDQEDANALNPTPRPQG